LELVDEAPVELLLGVYVLTYQLPHQVVLGALLPPGQAPQLLSGALRPRLIIAGLVIEKKNFRISRIKTSLATAD
jgi:hypothetical protein